MADRKHHDEDSAQSKPMGKAPEGAPTFKAGGGGAQQNQGPPQPPVQSHSQKAEILQYLKSQGRQPDDVVWSLGGMNLTLKDLEG
jgi:hypothetical protein